MKIRSGKGDKGFTDMVFHDRISKDSENMRAAGALDELNSYLGLLKAKIRIKKDKVLLEKIQHTVMTIASEILVESEKKRKLGVILQKSEADWINKMVYDMEQQIPIDTCFYVPGNNEVSAYFDVARAVARRAERRVVGLFHQKKIKNDHILSYLNCVSDVLFLLARKSDGTKRRRKNAK